MLSDCLFAGETHVSDKPLYDYQIKLQNDPAELAKFRKGGDTARASMSAHGVPSHLHDALLSPEPHKQAAVMKAVEHEISHGGAPHSFADNTIQFDDRDAEADQGGGGNS